MMEAGHLQIVGTQIPPPILSVMISLIHFTRNWIFFFCIQAQVQIQPQQQHLKDQSWVGFSQCKNLNSVLTFSFVSNRIWRCFDVVSFLFGLLCLNKTSNRSLVSISTFKNILAPFIFVVCLKVCPLIFFLKKLFVEQTWFNRLVKLQSFRLIRKRVANRFANNQKKKKDIALSKTLSFANKKIWISIRSFSSFKCQISKYRKGQRINYWDHSLLLLQAKYNKMKKQNLHLIMHQIRKSPSRNGTREKQKKKKKKKKKKPKPKHPSKMVFLGCVIKIRSKHPFIVCNVIFYRSKFDLVQLHFETRSQFFEDDFGANLLIHVLANFNFSRQEIRISGGVK